eukprot:TRINITY_DN32150_c0_g1_i1.p1 TRINITY_DN32150_c0_g1~~TRINITY_DN32150_c0_g1_i1.p1  ORF type:complete len:434 (-),score=36.68 TRINITY_DN32150_c0_g1_i1:303-1604(-)
MDLPMVGSATFCFLEGGLCSRIGEPSALCKQRPAPVRRCQTKSLAGVDGSGSASKSLGLAAMLAATTGRCWHRRSTKRLASISPRLSSAEERKQLSTLVSKWRANNREAWMSLAWTAFLYGAAVAALHCSGGHWASIIFLGFTLVRCFIVFHDAAHSSYFENPASNRRLAQILQFFVSYSYDEWNRVHNSHHSHFGDSTIKDTSLTIYFSEQELSEGPWYKRFLHRVIRDPIVFYPLAGLFVFFLNRPLQHGPYRVLLPFLVWQLLGVQTFIGYMLGSWLGGSLGVAAFHLQHHCNEPYRVKNGELRSHLDAAMLGSTRIPVAWPLSVFTYGIQYHHIHHYDTRVPGYRLKRCDAEGDAQQMWSGANTVTGLRAFKSLFHTVFSGTKKFADSEGRAQFSSFWPYSALGLQDNVSRGGSDIPLGAHQSAALSSS